MFKKIYENYLLAKQEKKSSYKELGLISTILTSIVLIIWLTLIFIIKSIDVSFVQSVLIIIYFICSFILNPIFLIITVFFTILQWKITLNKYTIFSLIFNLFLLVSITISIFIF